VISTGGSGLTELALAMRQSSLVEKRVEGVRDGVRCKDRHLMPYNYRRRGEAPVVFLPQHRGCNNIGVDFWQGRCYTNDTERAKGH